MIVSDMLRREARTFSDVQAAICTTEGCFSKSCFSPLEVEALQYLVPSGCWTRLISEQAIPDPTGYYGIHRRLSRLWLSRLTSDRHVMFLTALTRFPLLQSPVNHLSP